MPKTTTARSPNSLGVFKDHETDWVFKRTLEYMSEKAAEIGDCLFAANRIDERSRESWIVEWAALAGRVEQQAHELPGERSDHQRQRGTFTGL